MVFVHAKAQEEKFITDGFGVKRYPVMYNDFVLIGPKDDPAGVKGEKEVTAAFKRIKDKGASFVSRGDKSGTHTAELNLWKAAGIDIAKDKGPWYKEIGQGMGAALNTAASMNGYVLADRGTWLSFKNRGDLEILVEGRPPPVQPIWDHSRQSSQALTCQGGPWPSIHRLGGGARRPAGDSRLQDQRAAALFPTRLLVLRNRAGHGAFAASSRIDVDLNVPARGT